MKMWLTTKVYTCTAKWTFFSKKKKTEANNWDFKIIKQN